VVVEGGGATMSGDWECSKRESSGNAIWILAAKLLLLLYIFFSFLKYTFFRYVLKSCNFGL